MTTARARRGRAFRASRRQRGSPSRVGNTLAVRTCAVPSLGTESCQYRFLRCLTRTRHTRRRMMFQAIKLAFRSATAQKTILPQNRESGLGAYSHTGAAKQRAAEMPYATTNAIDRRCNAGGALELALTLVGLNLLMARATSSEPTDESPSGTKHSGRPNSILLFIGLSRTRYSWGRSWTRDAGRDGSVEGPPCP